MKYCSTPCSQMLYLGTENKERSTYLDAEDIAKFVDLLNVEVDVDLADLTGAHAVEEERDPLYSLARLRPLLPIGSCIKFNVKIESKARHLPRSFRTWPSSATSASRSLSVAIFFMLFGKAFCI